MRRFLYKTALILIVGLIIGYAIFAFRFFIEGPELTILMPVEDIASGPAIVKLVGTTKNVHALTINQKPMPLTESGSFSKETGLFPGNNTFTLIAKDKFGRSITTIKNIEYDGDDVYDNFTENKSQYISNLYEANDSGEITLTLPSPYEYISQSTIE